MERLMEVCGEECTVSHVKSREKKKVKKEIREGELPEMCLTCFKESKNESSPGVKSYFI